MERCERKSSVVLWMGLGARTEDQGGEGRYDKVTV